jgi:hypothetical protein
MRCKACDRILEDSELTKKDARGDFYDLCRNCLNSIYRSELYEDDYLVNVADVLLTLEEF